MEKLLAELTVARIVGVERDYGTKNMIRVQKVE
jgi:hypothetical protein